MLAEENKNAGTSALEGKEVLQGLIPFAFAPSSAEAISLDRSGSTSPIILFITACVIVQGRDFWMLLC